jgi:hypothetical protein
VNPANFRWFARTVFTTNQTMAFYWFFESRKAGEFSSFYVNNIGCRSDIHVIDRCRTGKRLFLSVERKNENILHLFIFWKYKRYKKTAESARLVTKRINYKSFVSKPRYWHSLLCCADLKQSRSTGIRCCAVLISNQAAVPAFTAVLCWSQTKPQYQHSLLCCADLKPSRSTGIRCCAVLFSNKAAIPVFVAVLCWP